MEDNKLSAGSYLPSISLNCLNDFHGCVHCTAIRRKKNACESTNADQTPIQINFDKVQEELLDPALALLKIKGGTTGKIFEAGDIREDMFSLLLMADLVIADITMHNANAFYELGIRHALRDRRTILIKSPGMSETPFDILGYRYLSYDYNAPGAALPDLVTMIRETVGSDRVDSPVFKVLPKLKSQDYEKFLVLPEGFVDEVRIARESGSVGKLSLLAYEAEDYNWAIPGLRLIGEALYQSRAFELAKLVWEKVKSELNLDTHANDRLATIYQRLAEKELSKNPIIRDRAPEQGRKRNRNITERPVFLGKRTIRRDLRFERPQ